MQRKGMEGRRDPRRGAESDAAQPLAGQPRTDDDEEDALQDPEAIPSFLTARELQARGPTVRPESEAADEPDAAAPDDGAKKGRSKAPR